VNAPPAATASARQQPSPQRIHPGSQAKAHAPPVHRGAAWAGAAQAWQEGPQCVASSSAKQEAPQAWKLESQARVQVPAPGEGPGWQTPRPGPADGPGQAAQAVPQLASPSTWQVSCPPGAAGQSRAGALQVKPQAPWKQAGLALGGAVQGTQAPAHLRSAPEQT
jgi:hypothetical protein